MRGRDPAFDFWGSLERRMHVEWVVVTVFMLLLTTGLGLFGGGVGLARVDHTFYDRILATTARSIDAADIVIVAIDDRSIADLGYWPWRRAVHARLLDQLKDARAVGFDIVFSDRNPAYPDDDQALAQAIAGHGKVVLPTIVGHAGSGVVLPLPELARAAAGMGHINIYPDEDGVVRSLVLRQPTSSGAVAEHFLLSMLDIGGDARPASSAHTGAAQLIPFGHVPNRFAVYPYARVLEGGVPSDAFRDKYVLVGAWASGSGDILPTPVSDGSGVMAGVEIIANAMQAAMLDEWIRKPAQWLSTLAACVPVLLICLLFRRLSPRRSFVAALAALALTFVGAGLLMRIAGVWIPMTASLIGIVLSFPVWSWRSQEVSLQHIDRELGALNRDRAALGDDTSAFTPRPDDASLSARVTQLHSVISQLRDAHVRREQTLGFLSHDMRAPQNSILALTQLQQQPETAMEPAAFLQHIDSYAYKTLELVDGFVHLARAQAMQIRFEPVELADLIEQSLDQFWAQARQRNIELRFDCRPSSAWTRGDASLLLRAISNLVDNALKYSPDFTCIECRLTAEGWRWRVSVHDEGEGFTPAQAATLFEAFSRLDEQRVSKPAGAGLGLAFVKTVVERHGGDLHVIAEKGQGAQFVLHFPAESADLARSTTLEPACAVEPRKRASQAPAIGSTGQAE